MDAGNPVVNTHELAWAAGFFDGEGSTHSNQPSLQLTVGQVNLDNLHRFMAAIGATSGLGKPKTYQNRKPFSQFRVYGAKAIRAINLLWPYLGKEKQMQAVRAMLIYGSRSVAPWRGGPLCSRGHLFSVVGMTGNRGCRACHADSGAGRLIPRRRISAFEARKGIREYQPAALCTAREAVAWTFDVPVAEYQPDIQT